MTARHSVRSYLPLVLALAFAAPAVARAQIEEPRIPLQTKLSEINRLRVEYAEDFNKHDIAGVLAMYSPEAIIVTPTGATKKGTAEITEHITQFAATVPHIIITSDSLAIYGNTAVDEGTLTAHPSAGGEQVTRYLAVLRRDMKGWKVVRVSSTPVTGM
jgi:ketosteroid isomerase-like protein